MDSQGATERERSEPCSVRANPFTEDESNISRKRQRTTKGGSRSRSVDATTNSNSSTNPTPAQTPTTRNSGNSADNIESPQTPPHMSSLSPPEPTSSRVTINIRTTRPLQSIPSSPVSPTLVGQDGPPAEMRTSAESESDALSTLPAIETPSSSPSQYSSPQVELIPMIEEDENYDDVDPPMAIIGDEEIYINPTRVFPYSSHNEPLMVTVNKVVQYLTTDEMDNPTCILKIRDWLESVVIYANDSRSLIDMVKKFPDFWLAIPDLIWAVGRRRWEYFTHESSVVNRQAGRLLFGPFMDYPREGRTALVELFSQFARLTARLVMADIRTVEDHPNQNSQEHPPFLISHPYLAAFNYLFMSKEQRHFGRCLDHNFNWRWCDELSVIAQSFQSEGGTLKNLLRLTEAQRLLVDQYPKLADRFADYSGAARALAEEAKDSLDQGGLHPSQIEVAKVTLLQGFDYFRLLSKLLLYIIEKHVTHITADSMANNLRNLTDIYRCSFSTDKSPVLRSTYDEFVANHPEVLHRHIAKVIAFSWKINMLRKLIMSTQMQLRVVGVSTMCGDLLELYSEEKGTNIAKNTMLLYFARTILEIRLVDYIVGVSSHPELINESSNIVGFLIVTKTYTGQQTDKIWDTAMSSQDPRVVEAILRMIVRLLNLYERETLLHLCEKFGEVPLTAFTAPMRDLCHNTLRELAGKAVNKNLSMPPFNLSIHLIREASVQSKELPVGFLDLQQFAACRLAELLQSGPGPEGRLEIYNNCMKDVSLRTRTASGSICVIATLLRQFYDDDLAVLSSDLISLMVEEMEALVSEVSNTSNQWLKPNLANQARREIVQLIITVEPRTISQHLGERLWDVLVGSKSGSVHDRNTSWQMINGVVKLSSFQNIYVLACFQDFFPKLPPHCFTTGALDFVREAVALWMAQVGPDFVENQLKFESQALDELWRMVLTAPPNTIEAAAIAGLVDVYIEGRLIHLLPATELRPIHLALVERCLNQLKDAALKLKAYDEGSASDSKDDMVVVTDDQFREQEIIFARSLAVLREFLSAYQKKPQFVTSRAGPILTATSSDIMGEPLTLKFQSFDGITESNIETITVGKLNTAAFLMSLLKTATGFEDCNVYCDGKLFNHRNLDDSQPLGDITFNGLVLVHLVRDREAPNTSLESEIMKHFDDLWEYLSMHERVAQEIYAFLIKFPVYCRLQRDLESDAVPYTEIFPTGQPYKSLYSIYALRNSPLASAQNGDASDSAIHRVISLIVAALSDKDVFANCTSAGTRDCLALSFVDCLVHFLRNKSLPDSADTLLSPSLLGHLLRFLSDAKAVSGSSNSIYLTSRSFEAMLEASLHSLEFWGYFQTYLKESSLLRELILDEQRPSIRKSVTKQIANRCKAVSGLARVSAVQLTAAFWPMVSSMIEEAVELPNQCEELFALSLVLFKKLGEAPLEFQSLDDLVIGWGNLLLSHTCDEVVGQPDSMDIVAQGLANLLRSASTFLKASQQTLSCRAIGVKLFRKCLFPDLSGDPDKDSAIKSIVPTLNQITRQAICDIVFNLVKDDEPHYQAVLKSLHSLVPYTTSPDGPYVYDMAYGFDRSRFIKSQTGYVGLRNLSNTCYLNSLFTQLYMNVPFRRFMMNAHITDCGNSQPLLQETQNLFSYMQNHVSRYIDPTRLANAIETYDNGSIDVTVQMDVDEFYNLLFDRWEGQILSEADKRTFKSFYGGQLVQQVKSKECPHISERLESFSAIQCDIKGKNSLEESLQAYVEGEIMEGENKYKCSTCDRHVDAVKRACLKDIPDNLIFHLKRFDFNLRTLQRSKINDYFTFPRSIDMRPYKVEHLMDNPDETPADIYELVGVLVHSGTAESGHYYSYTRERPSTGSHQTWVEYNDDIVSPWDTSSMDACCFGGVDTRLVNSGDQPLERPFSAYMLFYQRSSVLAHQNQALVESKISTPVRVEVPPHLANHITLDNELLLRKYCLYDPSHTAFVLKMLGNIQHINKGQCSETHKVEKLALISSLNHLDQVVARTKDLPDFRDFMDAVEAVCLRCAECSRDYLEWICDCPETLRHLLLRNPDTDVRSQTSELIMTTLLKVKADASYAYGFSDEDESSDELDGGDPQLLQNVVQCLAKMWEQFHTTTRAWPEYFGLLFKIAGMGQRESAALIDHNFLLRTLEVMCADQTWPISQQYARMLSIIQKRHLTRPVSFEAVITLLSILLAACDHSIIPQPDGTQRLQFALNDLPVPLAASEANLLFRHWQDTSVHTLTEKLLLCAHNEDATRDIVALLLRWPQNALDHFIRPAIASGVRATNVHSPPFIRAVLVYCEHTRVSNWIPWFIQFVAKSVQLADNSDGRVFIDFFRDITQISSFRSAITQEGILRLVLDNVQHWAPSLLTYYDSSVRADTETFLRAIIFTSDIDSTDNNEDDEKSVPITLTAPRKLGIACLEYISRRFIREREPAVRPAMVNIQDVISACVDFYDDNEDNHETHRFHELKESVLPALKRCLVDEADDETSAWDNSDGDGGYSSGQVESNGHGNDDIDLHLS